jgi:hypothetical protein
MSKPSFTTEEEIAALQAENRLLREIKTGRR